MSDAKLGGAIKEKLGIPCVSDESALQLTRGLRNQIESLVEAASASEMKSMAIGLAHSLSRYKLKFSPDKVDTMIVQVRHPPVILTLPRPPTPYHPSPTCYFAHEQLPPHLYDACKPRNFLLYDS